MPSKTAARKIAWGGIEFETPGDWDMSSHHSHRQVMSMVLEDAFNVRLELEWTSTARQDRMAHIEQRHSVFTKRIDREADSSATLSVPSPWVAHVYTMPDNRRMATAMLLGRSQPLMAFLRVYAQGREADSLGVLTRHLIESFRYHDQGLIPWRVYDLDLRIPEKLKLSGASFYAGRKLMIFEHRFRRLFIWQFSLANRLLGEDPPAVFAARFLNHFKGLPGPRFAVGPEGHLKAYRKWYHPLGHYEEIGRGCRRYHVQTILDQERNRLLIMVYHYRKPSDLEWIREVWPSVRDTDRRAFLANLQTDLARRWGTGSGTGR